jgi:hypothetical protein
MIEKQTFSCSECNLVTAAGNDLMDWCALLEIEFSDFIIHKSKTMRNI